MSLISKLSNSVNLGDRVQFMKEVGSVMLESYLYSEDDYALFAVGFDTFKVKLSEILRQSHVFCEECFPAGSGGGSFMERYKNNYDCESPFLSYVIHHMQDIVEMDVREYDYKNGTTVYPNKLKQYYTLLLRS